MTNRAILNEVKKHLNNFDEWTYKEEFDGNGIKFFPKFSFISNVELLKLIHTAQIYNLGFYISTEVGEDKPYFMIYNRI